jgi:GNAT superfamily N-acetyltransferase
VELCAIINEIVRIGGTTAHEDVFTVESFAGHFLDDKNFICCFTALFEGKAVGFQSLCRSDELPKGWGDIGTFARASNKVAGVGTLLFEHTEKLARAEGLAALHAIIRADNAPGLAYYSKMGFTDHAVKKNVPLEDGRVVDRLAKTFNLT